MDNTLTRDAERTARIRELNDTLRTYSKGGEIYLTRGVSAKGDDFIARVFRAVADFDDFDEGNDPHGEHDFGAVTVDGEKLYFKVDYYDRNKEYLSEDPADAEKTKRVMTPRRGVLTARPSLSPNLTTMGYLQVFGAKLEELLRTHGLTEAESREIIEYVKDIVLQSYRNGVEKGRSESAPQSNKSAPCKAWRPAKRTR